MTRPDAPTRRLGFTMVELLVVLSIIALLIALLIPAVNAAVRTAKNAAVQAEINNMAQALASFKSQYGDYPPSRIVLNESGAVLPTVGGIPSTKATADVHLGQLYQRTIVAFRKFWPRVVLSSGGPVFGTGATTWYDFNGDGTFAGNTAMVLQGHECLVFFLGGIPAWNSGRVTGVSGFGKNPTNPFLNQAVTSNRTAPLYEFDGSRLVTNSITGMPGYLDSLSSTSTPTPQNFYSYFSTNNGSGYDPNDVNFEGPAASPTYVAQLYQAEADVNLKAPIGASFLVSFPVYNAAGQVTPSVTQSPSPNPYTSSASAGGSTVTYINGQSFQILSAGIDGQFGIGGLYAPNSTTAALPPVGSLTNSTDPGVRQMENDNLSNFHNGRLQ